MALIEMSTVEESILALIVSDVYHVSSITSLCVCVTPGCSQLPNKFQLSSEGVIY